MGNPRELKGESVSNEISPVGVSDEERQKRSEVLSSEKQKSLEENWHDQDVLDREIQEKAMAPPIIREPRCYVCTHPYRVWIERQIALGKPDERIAKYLKTNCPNENNPDRQSIKYHYREHMALEAAQIREELDAQAAMLNQNTETSVQGAITNRGVLQVFVQKIYKDVIDGIASGEMKDAVSIIKLLNEMTTNESQQKVEELEAYFRLFLQAIQNVLTEEERAALSAEVKRLRDEEELTYKVEGYLPKEQAVIEEAEVVNAVPDLE